MRLKLLLSFIAPLIVIQIFFHSALASEFKIHNPEEREEAWNFAAGIRGNYLRLGGGISSYDAEHDSHYDIDYGDIGMDNYAPSASLALSGEWGKWNLFFAATRGVYDGSFVTQQDFWLREGGIIKKGTSVDGQIEMGIYSLSGTYDLAASPTYNVSLGFGALILDYGMEFTSSDGTIGSNAILPMPYLALSGRKDIGKYRFIGVGGGAYYSGDYDDHDYTVYFVTMDARAGYEFYQNGNYSSTFYLGYRYLFMDSTASKDGSWYKEEDTYAGPFVSLTVKYTKLLSP